jgi:cell wall-associated NlpC family hydrolase
MMILLGVHIDTAFSEPNENKSYNEINAELSELQKAIEQASDDYYNAVAEHDVAEQNVSNIMIEISEIEEKREQAERIFNDRIVSMYKQESPNPIWDIITESSTINELIASWSAYEQLCRNDAQLVVKLEKFRTESETKATQAQEQAKKASQKAAQAEAIRNEAEAKVKEYEKKLASIGKQQRSVQQQVAQANAIAILSLENIDGTPEEKANKKHIVEAAISRIGCPYVWATAGPDTFDCCGLTRWCYKQAGMKVPSGTRPQYDAAKERLPISQAQAGDILYMNGHVGLYIGENKAIHAPHPGAFVCLTSASMFSYACRF